MEQISKSKHRHQLDNLTRKKHTAKDEEVDLEFVGQNQQKLNGHVSMLLKIFLMGKN